MMILSMLARQDDIQGASTIFRNIKQCPKCIDNIQEDQTLSKQGAPEAIMGKRG